MERSEIQESAGFPLLHPTYASPIMSVLGDEDEKGAK
jgi:hypothetical protein